MQELGVKSEKHGIDKHGLKNLNRVFWNLTAPDTIEHAVRNRLHVDIDVGRRQKQAGCDEGRVA